EETRLSLYRLGRELADRLEIVEYPEGPAVRREDKVGVLDDQVVDRHDRKVAAETVPVRTVIERDIHAGLGAGVEQSLARGVLADDAREVVRGNAVRELRPGAPVVRRLPQVRLEVIVLVAGRRQVRGGRVVGRRLDARDQRETPGRHTRHAIPGLPARA